MGGAISLFWTDNSGMRESKDYKYISKFNTRYNSDIFILDDRFVMRKYNYEINHHDRAQINVNWNKDITQ